MQYPSPPHLSIHPSMPWLVGSYTYLSSPLTLSLVCRGWGSCKPSTPCRHLMSVSALQEPGLAFSCTRTGPLPLLTLLHLQPIGRQLLARHQSQPGLASKHDSRSRCLLGSSPDTSRSLPFPFLLLLPPSRPVCYLPRAGLSISVRRRGLSTGHRQLSRSLPLRPRLAGSRARLEPPAGPTPARTLTRTRLPCDPPELRPSLHQGSYLLGLATLRRLDNAVCPQPSPGAAKAAPGSQSRSWPNSRARRCSASRGRSPCSTSFPTAATSACTAAPVLQPQPRSHHASQAADGRVTPSTWISAPCSNAPTQMSLPRIPNSLDPPSCRHRRVPPQFMGSCPRRSRHLLRPARCPTPGATCLP